MSVWALVSVLIHATCSSYVLVNVTFSVFKVVASFNSGRAPE